MKRKKDSGIQKSKPTTRRQFLKIAGIGGLSAASLYLLGCAAKETTVTETVTTTVIGPGVTTTVTGPGTTATGSHPTEWAYETDVLVIGLGLGGLCAALRATEQGASVIGVDKSNRVPSVTSPTWEGRNLAKRASIGGNFNHSGQLFHIQQASLSWPTEQIWSHVRGPVYHVGDPANAPVQEKLVNNANQSINWLATKMADNPDIDLIESAYAGPLSEVFPIKDDPWMYWELRRKPGGVADYTKYGAYKTSMHLLSKIEAAGGTVLEETAAKKLITNDDGEVIGAKVRPVEGGATYNIKAKAVVLSTGGFQKNKELMTRWFGSRAENWIPSCIQSNTGDGQVMAQEVGASFINLSRNYCEFTPYDARFNPDMSMSFSSIFIIPGGSPMIMVNENGDRVCDEAGTRFYLGDTMVRSHDVNLRHLFIFDNDVRQSPGFKETIDEMLRVGFPKSLFSANTLQGLAEATVAAADDDLRTHSGWLFSPRLVDTVAEYNAAVAAGTCDRLSPPKTNDLVPIVTPPFWGVIMLPGTGWTQGGPKINTDGAILDRDEIPISGLYGAGDVVTGNSMGRTLNEHGGYVGGLAPALIWGLISGESAAAYAQTV